ncbi:MAG: 23S rRNA (pseudouridine(1915)-N(3))-methyltransferase RlmH [Ignavibacteriales bacterium]|nr:23S rRNA (pseudouridine(1915)-N(3))-methyltransferase RlmH [Ignavibacteriales bacterium]
MHIKFVWVGKTRNEPIKILISDCLDRLSHLTACEAVDVPDAGKGAHFMGRNCWRRKQQALKSSLTPAACLWFLTSNGRQFKSTEFSSLVCSRARSRDPRSDFCYRRAGRLSRRNIRVCADEIVPGQDDLDA